MNTVRRELYVAPDHAELNRAAATEFVQRARDATTLNGRFTVALAGGSTPRSLYTLLADPHDTFFFQMPWKETHFFWGDERHVPPQHAESNYRMAWEAMLSKVPVARENVHRIKAEHLSAGDAADDYEKELRRSFGLVDAEVPRFDLVLLGLGACGHTASLFPGTAVLKETKRLVAAQWIAKFNASRVTLTPLIINNAVEIMFLVAGADKAEAVKTVWEGDYEPDRCPAQLIQPGEGRVMWLTDQAAAELLSRF